MTGSLEQRATRIEFDKWWGIAKKQPPYSNPEAIARSAWDAVRRLTAEQQKQEPDGEVVAGTGSLNDLVVIKWISDYHPTVGDKIYAAPPQDTQDGMVRVPRGTTDAMQHAGVKAAQSKVNNEQPWGEYVFRIYRAMLDAAMRGKGGK